jgi:hypothetical protein
LEQEELQARQELEEELAEIHRLALLLPTEVEVEVQETEHQLPVTEGTEAQEEEQEDTMRPEQPEPETVEAIRHPKVITAVLIMAPWVTRSVEVEEALVMLDTMLHQHRQVMAAMEQLLRFPVHRWLTPVEAEEARPVQAAQLGMVALEEVEMEKARLVQQVMLELMVLAVEVVAAATQPVAAKVAMALS